MLLTLFLVLEAEQAAASAGHPRHGSRFFAFFPLLRLRSSRQTVVSQWQLLLRRRRRRDKRHRGLRRLQFRGRQIGASPAHHLRAAKREASAGGRGRGGGGGDQRDAADRKGQQRWFRGWQFRLCRRPITSWRRRRRRRLRRQRFISLFVVVLGLVPLPHIHAPCLAEHSSSTKPPQLRERLKKNRGGETSAKKPTTATAPRPRTPRVTPRSLSVAAARAASQPRSHHSALYRTPPLLTIFLFAAIGRGRNIKQGSTVEFVLLARAPR